MEGKIRFKDLSLPLKLAIIPLWIILLIWILTGIWILSILLG